VRVQLGVLNRDKFPYTLDVVFSGKGHEITVGIRVGYTSTTSTLSPKNTCE
jgi:hypothetical protein